MIRHGLVCMSTCLCFGLGVNAAENDLRSLKTAELIALLTSKNPAPTMEDQLRYEVAKYPSGYEHKRQRVVIEAAMELKRRGTAVFPELIDALDDTRYSCLLGSRDTPWARTLVTVGKMAWWILEVQVDAGMYAIDEDHDMPPLLPTIDLDKTNFEKWWKARKKWSLKEVQKESLDKLERQVKKWSSSSTPEYDKSIHRQLEGLKLKLDQRGTFLEATAPIATVENEILFFIEDFRVKLRHEKGGQ